MDHPAGLAPAQCTSCLPQTVPGNAPHMGPSSIFPHLLGPTVSLLCAQGLGRPSHCPLLSDPPQNGPWCCRHGRLWARAPRGHWMSPPLQDPATYDRRPSAPARRGTGRLCLPHQPRSGWASAHTPRPPVGTSAPIWPLAVPLLMPCEGQSLCPDPAASSPYPQPPPTPTTHLARGVSCPIQDTSCILSLTSRRPWARPCTAIGARDT